MVTDWLKCLASNTQMQLLCRDFEQDLHLQSLSNVDVLFETAVCTSQLWKENKIKCSCIALYYVQFKRAKQFIYLTALQLLVTDQHFTFCVTV